MTLLNIVTEVAQRASLTLTANLPNNETVKSHLVRAFNMFHKDFNGRHPWPWRQKTTTLQTIANYTTGTVTVTSGSRTVTGAGGATFTTAMEGRFLKLNRDTDFYQIKDVPDSGTFVLEEPYVGDDGSALAYSIWNKFYNLPPDVPDGVEINLWTWPYRSKPIPKKDFDSTFTTANLSGYPEAWAWYGINRVVSNYTTGTVSFTINTRTLTGSGTSFIGNVFPGTRITIGVNVYNVESVDSDTQCTMVQNSVVTVTASTYTARTANRSQIVLSSTANPVINLHITYPKRTYDYLNDNDELEIWDGYEHILVNVIYGYILEKLTSEKSFSWLTVYEAQVKDAWRRVCENDSQETATWYGKTFYSQEYFR